MKFNKFLKRKSLIFSDVFAIKEEKNDNEEKDSKSEKESVEETEENEKTFEKEENEKNEEKKMEKRKRNSKLEEKLRNDFLKSPITILIYKGTKKDSILFKSTQTIPDLIKYLINNNYLSNTDKEKKNFKILYGLGQLKYDDNRKIYEILSEKRNNKLLEKESQIRVIIKTNEKEFLKNKVIEKVYVTLENIPSFMDLSDQINIFINQHKENIQYDIKFKNNCCTIMFVSSEISFSFVTFMTNLKFKNKYYRKLIIKMKYNNINNLFQQKDNFLNNNSMIPKRNNSLLNSKNIHNSELDLRINNYQQKSISYRNLVIKTEPNQIYDYFTDRYNSINQSTPYDQEKILNKLEKEKNKKKWITHKGFFNGVNTKSFNRFINPYKNRISLFNIANNKERKIFLNVNNL